MTCAEAIERVLEEAGAPLRAAQIAEEIDARGLYRRGDGLPLPAYQVSSVAHGQPERFRIEGGLISLPADSPPRATDGDPLPSPPAEGARCVLIGCVSRKEPTARAAKDLYRTELFARRRAYAEGSGQPWLIVSALHGLVGPDDVVEPYDVRLSDLTWQERHALADDIAADLE